MAINRYIVILLAFLCSFAIVGCDDYNDVDYPDTKLIKGQWQLVEDGDTDNPLIYRFTTDSEIFCFMIGLEMMLSLVLP